ncbi:CDF family Co(II)/Ni(II) efflux transporter DmeF (plasmid) [Cupriavidus sp. P-10]|uniref:CDF family Co(II)/Ni(II) efflux transporter DmeF n=1 Tax=unclassified Cupriavidus TaxID=2640874 RepID=UPI000E2F8AD6|nr:CDF family Co(II)/Ni(II) efflux transporter DmeF [Cupriavidus sp. P-10]BDB30597.1 CDF family Co(II)/Ni(II) efflux transporter DmeF [Cupriavidus sp. P-10]
MHATDLSRWTHTHVFDDGNEVAERKTRLVMILTAITMVMEIAAGLWFNSMALLADGWHMSSHAFAIGLTAFAYAAARTYAKDQRFAFGAWKIEVLAGFASAVFLLGIAALMVFGSFERIFSPQAIHYKEAMAVTVFGLLVNLGCALILGGRHDHGHGGEHDEHRHHRHREDHQHDLNLRSAYLHVLADAATSVLALLALAGGWWLGWGWLDPIMGIVGAALVGSWALRLLKSTAVVLLDREMDHSVVDEIREVLDTFKDGEKGARMVDLHVWRVGKEKFSCIVSLVSHDATLTPTMVKKAIQIHDEVVHVTVEIHHCGA